MKYNLGKGIEFGSDLVYLPKSTDNYIGFYVFIGNVEFACIDCNYVKFLFAFRLFHSRKYLLLDEICLIESIRKWFFASIRRKTT